MSIFRGQTDQADFLSPLLDHGGFGKLIGEKRFARDICVGHQHREFHCIHKPAQNFGTIVEFMVAHGHRVIAHLVHHLSGECTLVLGVKQRALKLVTAIHKDAVACPLARLGDRGHQTGRAAETFASGIVLGTAGTVIFADRLKPSVEIIGVQNGEVILSRRHATGQSQRCGRGQESFHDSSPVGCYAGIVARGLVCVKGHITCPMVTRGS